MSYWPDTDQGQLCLLNFGAAAFLYTSLKPKKKKKALGRIEIGMKVGGGRALPSYLHTGQDVFYILSHVKGPKLRVIPYPLGRCLQF